ncbi:MAG TPA: transcriptional repressor LexA [Clostridiaceae bacterium]|nr:transcriptional repressor LexA [Clostridiaceae bacterium]
MEKYPFTRATVEQTVEKVYDYIVEYTRKNGFSPSIRDICKGVGIKSTSTVHNHLRRLRKSGRIEMKAGKRRAISVPALEMSRERKIPLVGRVTAGVPILATQNIECELPVPAGYFAEADEMFALNVSGDSMKDAHILDGDIVFVRKQPTAELGQIVVALLDNEATVKRLVKENNRIYLKPENKAYDMILFEDESYRILGVVRGVFRPML